MKTGCRVLIVLFWFVGVALGAEPPPLRDYSARCAEYYANVYQVPVEFVDAVIEVESNWQPYALSPKGAAGLMQLMPATAVRLGVPNRRERSRGGRVSGLVDTPLRRRPQAGDCSLLRGRAPDPRQGP
jgi:hypothetical protein